MPTYKLTYFNVKARAETARMMFKLAGQDFEDIRVTSEQWQEMKPKTPMGQLPLLDIDGVTICQSNAINRYIANQFGYAGKTPIDKARVDMVIDSIEDALPKLRAIFSEEDKDKKAALADKAKTETVIPLFENLNKVLEQNNGGFMVGDEVTMADLSFLNMGGLLLMVVNGGDIWDQFPKIKAVMDKVSAIPAIKKWIEERPKSDM